ncbi:hypothetical protein TPA0910_87540 [Streptomyces hygroscopicus subsp. sporocinereus]|uniref:Uncharacterized protein n=1 Tax=Streptomyces hygroscopicus TaxID=1912 RepID=A0ABQ3UFT6_STRHY|nr:hypothetical protein [Streptomyces hygroscopicus]GHJ34321.1 hypothetical protein TPA0910_87540 [Streptomyces hygroscopicus]
MTTQTSATSTPTAVMDDELLGLIEDLGQGFGPEICQIVAGFKALALKAHTVDSTQTAIAVIGGNCPNLVSLAAQVAAHLGNADTNPALRDLPADRQDQARNLTAQYAAYDEVFAPQQLLSEAAAAIDGMA